MRVALLWVVWSGAEEPVSVAADLMPEQGPMLEDERKFLTGAQSGCCPEKNVLLVSPWPEDQPAIAILNSSSWRVEAVGSCAGFSPWRGHSGRPHGKGFAGRKPARDPGGCRAAEESSASDCDLAAS